MIYIYFLWKIYQYIYYVKTSEQHLTEHQKTVSHIFTESQTAPGTHHVKQVLTLQHIVFFLTIKWQMMFLFSQKLL